jgi:hypothetical protein
MSIQNPTSARFSIRKARSGDCDGILECLAAAFASVRDSYTREAFLDTVLTPDTVKKRLQDMVVHLFRMQSRWRDSRYGYNSWRDAVS